MFNDPSGHIPGGPYNPMPQIEGNDDTTRAANKQAKNIYYSQVKSGPTKKKKDTPKQSEYFPGTSNTCGIMNAGFAGDIEPSSLMELALMSDEIPESMLYPEDIVALFEGNKEWTAGYGAAFGRNGIIKVAGNQHANFDALKEAMNTGKELILLVRADHLTGEIDDNGVGHYITITNIPESTTVKDGQIEYYDSISGSYLQTTWADLKSSWELESTHIVVLTPKDMNSNYGR